LGCIIIIISSAWGGGSGTSYESALAARIFQGIGLAPFEGLLNAVVGDLYFVHERGLRMALTNFCVFGGSFLTPVIAGRIARHMGWPWTFYFIAIFSAMMLPALIFFMPETAYKRDASLDTDIGGLVMIGEGRLAVAEEALNRTHQRHSQQPAGQQETNAEGDSPPTRSSAGISEKVDEVEAPSGKATLAEPVPAKTTYAQSLRLFNGRKTEESFLKLFIRPFILLFHPAIMWAYLIQGAMIGWTVFIGVCIAAILISPPLFFNEEQTGYEYTGAFIGALIGFIIAGALGDSVPALMTRLNRGRYEPEFRLILVIPQLILGCAGLYGFGIVSNDIMKYRWLWPSFFFSLEVAGMVVGAVASSLYIVDAYRRSAH
jgi:MFS family permease